MVLARGRILVSLGHHHIAEVSYFQGSLSYGGSQRSCLSEFGSQIHCIVEISVTTSRGHPPMVAASNCIWVSLGHCPIAEVRTTTSRGHPSMVAASDYI